MKIILITGLDGSGKSTVFTRLSELLPIPGVDILLLPHLDVESLRDDAELYRAAKMINALGYDADARAIPQLKAIALFGAMLLFEKIRVLKQALGVQILYCERHPLVDTGVYARFYAGKLGPGVLPDAILQETDARFGPELEFLFACLPEEVRRDKKAGTAAFMDFIYHWFYEEKRYHPEQLQALFGAAYPDRMYYLRADPEVLMDRLGNRSTREAHETLEVLGRLGQVYDELFAHFPTPVEVVDANSFGSLDLYWERIVREIR